MLVLQSICLRGLYRWYIDSKPSHLSPGSAGFRQKTYGTIWNERFGRSHHLTWFLGIHVKQWLCQDSYIEITSCYKLKFKNSKSPMSQGQAFTRNKGQTSLLLLSPAPTSHAPQVNCQSSLLTTTWSFQGCGQTYYNSYLYGTKSLAIEYSPTLSYAQATDHVEMRKAHKDTRLSFLVGPSLLSK